MGGNDFEEQLTAFIVWLSESKLEDVKHVKLYLAGIVCIQLSIWGSEQITCGIPINIWLLVSSMQMLFEVFSRSRKVYVSEQFLNSTIGATPGAIRVSMRTAISKLKAISIVSTTVELLLVAWIFYGLHIFYSEENTCNWETKHSFGYVVMFIILTLGMILIFKWFLKIIEVICCILKLVKDFTVVRLRRVPLINRRLGPQRVRRRP